MRSVVGAVGQLFKHFEGLGTLLEPVVLGLGSSGFVIRDEPGTVVYGRIRVLIYHESSHVTRIDSVTPNLCRKLIQFDTKVEKGISSIYLIALSIEIGARNGILFPDVSSCYLLRLREVLESRYDLFSRCIFPILSLIVRGEG